MPTRGVDPRTVLATLLEAAPGAMAVLVGSGMSRSAGIPTGWEVVQDLIRRVAQAEGHASAEIDDHPEDWWASTYGGDPRYDTIVDALGLTPSARQALLRRYFDPTPEQGGPILPTPGHNALASLVASGRIRVIVTTNFDRLIERSLDAAGVTPQVISSAAGVKGMTPLVHARSTLVKVNGDYASLNLRNTASELATYPAPLRKLLDQIFDEHGLVVVGWSADYDVALADSLRGASSRRYPMFWTAMNGHLREPAKRLVDQKSATVVSIASADEFFIDIGDRVARLDAVAARRGRPVTLPMSRHRPDVRSVDKGWAHKPLLEMRVAIELGPAPTAALGKLRTEQRKRLVQALESAAVTARIRDLSDRTPAADVGPSPGASPEVVSWDWHRTPGAYQNSTYAFYRIGGDARVGISALCGVRPEGGSILASIDVGLSLADKITPKDVGLLLRDALSALALKLPSALTDFLPPGAAATEIELHLLAATQRVDGSNRPNDLGQQIDLGPWGEPTRDVETSMNYAVQIGDLIGQGGLAELVLNALDDMALDAGFLDAGPAISGLRQLLNS